ncbi:hypothetical protein IFR04_004829 [Cadophora malorum]|uniref:Ubiquitin-like domain-containing protein n=1 Tax=Cadophora malorum TaxID=108018 RepID=A0A8H7WC51_9HELO|nr:hypothetical protein IFR04_004829 [Cadophora malorum]
MSFGFSAGDFVASISLITKVVKALNASTGSVAEVKTLAGTLESLKNAIQTSGDIYRQFGEIDGNDGTSLVAMEMRSSIERERQRCDEILESFMKTLKPYQDSFSENGSSQLVRHARKIGWLLRQDDAVGLNCSLTSHLTALDIYCKLLSRLRTESLLQTASTILSNVLDLRAEVTSITDSLQPLHSIPSSLGYPWEVRSAIADTVTLLDAVGRTILLPWILMGSIEDLHQLLLIMYRDIPGQKKILAREYNLTDDTDEDLDGGMVDNSNWETTIRRGMQLSLNIIMPTSHWVDLQSCPQCKTVCFSHNLPQKRRRCQQCQLTFRIFDKERLISDNSNTCFDESFSLQAQNTGGGLLPLNSPCREMASGRNDTVRFRNIHYHREVLKLQRSNENGPGTTITRQLVIEELPPLHKAAATGNVSEINGLLDEGGNVDFPLPFDAILSSPRLPDWEPMKFGGCTPLHLACWFGKLSTIESLLDRGAKILTQVPAHKYEALTFALQGHDPDRVFHLLVARGARIEYQDIHGESPLTTACALGKVLLIHYFLDRGTSLEVSDTSGTTPLQFAARGGHSQAFELLLAAEADIEPKWAVSSGQLYQFSTLHCAAQGGSVKIIKHLLRRGQDPNQVCHFGLSPFHWALDRGHLEASKILLCYTANIHSIHKLGMSTLHSAAFASLHEAVELLVEQGADCNHETEYGHTSLHQACSCTNIGSRSAQELTVTALLKLGAHVNASDVFGETPLHWAALNSRSRLTEILLNHGAKVDATSRLGETPLHFASRKGCNESVKLLIEHGADVNARCENGFTPFVEAVYSGNTETARMLLEHGAGINACDVLGLTALHYVFWSTCAGKEDLLKLLLGGGANAQSSSLDATTPLHYAAALGHSDHVQLLLDHKTNVDVLHGLGRTALHSAARWGRTGCIEILLASGADIHTTAPAICKVSVPGEEFMLEVAGCTPLICAAEHGHVAAVKLLLEHGAAVNVVRVDGKTTLSCAVESGNIEIVQLLLNSGADVEIRNWAGLTSLVQASRNNKDDIVKVILERGADIDARDNEGRTALHWAAFRGFESTARILIEHGAQFASDHLGRTPLHDAVYNGSEPLVKFLLDNGADPMARLADRTTLACWIRYTSQKTGSVEVKAETKAGLFESTKENAEVLETEATMTDLPVVRLALDIARIRGWMSIMELLVKD